MNENLTAADLAAFYEAGVRFGQEQAVVIAICLDLLPQSSEPELVAVLGVDKSILDPERWA